MGKRTKSIFKIFGVLYQRLIANKKEEVNFWILLSFIGSFSISRFVVYNFPALSLHVRHVHIHHFAYGILILAVIGILALNDVHHHYQRVFGFIYGIGLGLAMDEFGMWIRLDDSYWIRHSYDAVIITSAILIFIVYFQWFWQKIFIKLQRDDPDDDDIYWSET